MPDNFWRVLIIGFILYSFFVVGKIIYDNWQANKQIDKQREDIVNLKNQIEDLKLRIVYYKTDTYKEKIARGKLRYALPGETTVTVPYDPTSENTSITNTAPIVIAKPNYYYWGIYFFGQ